jgi:glutamate carboxypeptidase
MSAILEYLKQRQDDMILSLEMLVKSESPSDSKELVDQCGELLQRMFGEHLQLSPEVFPQTHVGNHYKYTFGSGDEQILMLGHFDTVWDKGRLSYRLEGNKAYGPGIFDMKGGIIQALWALISLKQLGIRLRKKIVFLLTSDEEIGSHSSRHLIEAEAAKSAAVLVMEPSVSLTGALKTARKGLGIYHLKITGFSSHAGNDHNIGISAIEELAHQIIRLQKITDYAQGTTVNVGTVKGGGRVNVVADYAEADIDLRIASRSEAAKNDALIRNLLPVIKGTSIEVTGGINRPPFEKTEEIQQLVTKAQQIAVSLGFQLDDVSVGGASDGNFTASLGIPTLDGLGAVGDGPHALHEHVLLDHIPYRAALIAHMLMEI